MASTPGTQLGSYQVLKRLGSGGMGEVYLAHDPRLDRRVAIKVLPAHLAADAVARERLRREALAAAALDHPFICKIFEIGEDQGTLFIVMEYISGETLHARLRAGALPQSDALRIAGEVAEALEEAHAKPLVHRDLKPANVMLTPQGRVKVMDFGLAKRLRSDEIKDIGATLTVDDLPLTAQGAVTGTPEYMSPEQAKGAPLDRRSDLFSFGIILCELLTGKHPFERNTKLETMMAILRDQPDLAVTGNAGLSPGQMVLIRRLLAKSPDERYQSMREVREDLARLASSSTATAEPEEAARPSVPLIGRDPERAELVRHLERALAGHGSLVLIGGEPGIGKTHLTRAILAEAARRGCYTAVGHCYEMEGAPPYVPFIEMLEYAARVVPRESFRYALGSAAPEVAKLMPELRQMFPDIPAPLDLPPEQQRRFLFNAYREYLERAARAGPIVRVFEDLHWGDEPTLLLLQHLAQTVATVPMLLIGTYRDVELDVARPFARVLESLIREKLASRMMLRRLPMASVEALLAALSGQTPPPSLARVVFAETEGNPFFVEEVFRHLAEEGKLFDEDGAWRPELRVDQLQVPEGVRLVLGRRLERLGGEARRVLTTAAVIGRSFSLRLLEDLEKAHSTAGVDTALEAVEEAERAHLVVPEHAGRETRYRFVHELVRHTLSETLSLPRRQRLHARVADAVEQLYASNRESQVPVLAHHLYQAGAAADPDKTLKYLMMAAQLASAGAAHEEALAHYDNALSLIEDDRDARAAELHAGRAVALRSLGRHAEAVDSYERAVALFSEKGDVRAAGEISFQLAIIHGWNADGQRALDVLDRALCLLGPEPSALRHRLLVYRATCLGAFVDIEAGFTALTEAKLVEASLPEGSADGFTSMLVARHHFVAGQLDRTDECAREAVTRFRAAGDLWGESEVWEPIAVALWTGRPIEAEGLIRDLVARAERVGNQNAIAMCRSFSAEMHLATGELEQAERAASESFDLGRSIFAPSGWLFLNTVVLGSLAHYCGRFDEAAQWFRRGMEIEPHTAWSGMLAGALFWTLATKGDSTAAEALTRAYKLLPVPGRLLSGGACGCLGFVVEGLAWLGRHEEAAALQPHGEHVVANGPLCVYGQHLFRTSAGIAAACAHNWSRAEEHHQAAIHQADTAPYRVAQPIARFWYAEMLLERDTTGDRARAHNLLEEALAMFGSLGILVYASRASEKLASLNP
jgi:tetratricopeptide (TPR) repeat protein